MNKFIYLVFFSSHNPGFSWLAKCFNALGMSVGVKFGCCVSGTNSSVAVVVNSGLQAEGIIVDVFNFEYSRRNCLFFNVIRPEPSVLTCCC